MVTASSERQAGLYREEIERRRLAGMLPEGMQFVVTPDPDDRRVGSGGATIHALGALGKDRAWWSGHRALLIHSGGDSRRLPQYSPGGKLFGVLPSRTQPRGTTTVFDQTLALSAAWAQRIPNGLLVASGDVVLRFDADKVQWDRRGVTGVAMRLDAETGSHHGVYVVGTGDQVYTFLQKPAAAEVKAAGGLLEDGRVAVDIGLLRFDAGMTAALAELAQFKPLPAVDLYDEISNNKNLNQGKDVDAFVTAVNDTQTKLNIVINGEEGYLDQVGQDKIMCSNLQRGTNLLLGERGDLAR